MSEKKRTKADAVSMWQHYQAALQKRPLQTKAITSAAMGAFGEIVAHGLKHKSLQGLSLQRILAFALYSGGITAPVMHAWYGFLEQCRVRGDRLSNNGKLLFDRLLLTPPFLALTLFTLSLLTGASVAASKTLVRTKYITALWMNWKVWTLTQYLSFNYVPPHLRVLWGINAPACMAPSTA
ncbi:hypothetical protein, variant [Saprolegnia diclina VS20]|uniref:Peroxisomal membrane protein 2 n=1 Tax=Saprolegnia diclina (strain VS20) TaxID=1156394 RepID=T0SES2_SAPDV|nr:hypothetical protein, variant [Saprolegnia diclina VS20]EQC41422.1 hypothetical protein, variant [Saprolegnia diclina VS20]|eukprot:XP_008605136.1 hypothetical protein, variant [Saprolegnia diclina VS20]